MTRTDRVPNRCHVEFVPPDADRRWQLWLAHLPAGHQADPGLVQDIARRCVLTGGQIRNATLHATLLSLERGGPVDDHDVLAAQEPAAPHRPRGGHIAAGTGRADRRCAALGSGTA